MKTTKIVVDTGPFPWKEAVKITLRTCAIFAAIYVPFFTLYLHFGLDK